VRRRFEKYLDIGRVGVDPPTRREHREGRQVVDIGDYTGLRKGNGVGDDLSRRKRSSQMLGIRVVWKGRVGL
jgi:hypothetical protein